MIILDQELAECASCHKIFERIHLKKYFIDRTGEAYYLCKTCNLRSKYGE